MYPSLPRSPADLVPLPQCDGPKLKPFDFRGPQKIEFLEHLGQGMHSHVFKIKIRGKIYALKLFRFLAHNDWYGPPYWARNDPDSLEYSSLYSEPFNAECRVFGRLEETGYTDLAVKCFGYVLLDEENERSLMNRFRNDGLNFNGALPRSGNTDYRGHFADEDGSLPPIRGIIKEFGDVERDLDIRFLRKIRRDIIQLQQLGIFSIDVALRQYIDGKLADFSTAFTVPHFLTNPELNPSLTATAKDAMEYETFVLTLTDYWDLDELIDDWNSDPIARGKDKLQFITLPTHKYNLRSTPRRDHLYTLVDPRSFDWQNLANNAGEGASKPGTRRPSSRKANSGSKRSQRVSKNRLRLPEKPPRWYYHCGPEEAERLRRAARGPWHLKWEILGDELVPWRQYRASGEPNRYFVRPSERDFE